MTSETEARRTRRRIEDGVCEVNYVDRVKTQAAQASLPPDDAVSAAAEVLRVLGHPSRLKVIAALEDRELCVCDLSRVLGASLSGTSQHLRALRTLGIISYRAEGKLAYYRLVDRFWLDVTGAVLQKIGQETSAARRHRGGSSAS